MQKWLDDNDMLMYSTHNKGKTNFSKMIVNNKKSYLLYLDKLLDEYNNSYYHSIDKKAFNTD